MGSYILKEISGGRHTLLYKNSREVRIHSAYDPDREAERAVEGFAIGRASMIAVSGVGLGYHLDSLKRKFPGTPIVAVEHDPEVVEIARHTCPRHLEGVTVVTSAAGLTAIFEEIDISGFRGIAHFLHRPSYLLYREFYDSIMRDMGQYVSSKISDLLTRVEFEERWVENILANAGHLFSATRVLDLFGAFAGCPGIIVSAGPGLRKNVALLERMRDRALIVAVDTAAPVLRKRNIVPHFIMTIDAQKYSIKHFLGQRGDGAVLLADMVSCPHVVRSYRGPRIMSTTSKFYTPAGGGETKREASPLMEWIEQYAGPVGDIQSGGSVATSAFDLLLNLGCSPIILVGQDLAYTGREIHCSGTHHNDEWQTRISRVMNLDMINQGVIRRRKIKRVPACGGGTVVSDFVFDLYRGWFEDSAGKVKVPVINATESGARIANTAERSLSSLVDEFPARDPLPAEIIDRALARAGRVGPERLAGAMRQAVNDLSRIRDAAEKAVDDRTGTMAVEDMLNAPDMRVILLPFLRKARTFLARYSAAPEEGERLMLRDIQSAAGKLIPAMERSLQELEGMG